MDQPDIFLFVVTHALLARGLLDVDRTTTHPATCLPSISHSPMIGGIEMYHPYLFQILMREREREILEGIGRPGYHARRRRGGSSLSKNIAYHLHSALIRLKAIVRPRHTRHNQQQTADVDGGNR